MLLPHYVVVNYKLNTDAGTTPVGEFETHIHKPISHLQGDIVKLTISNIVLELVGDDIKFSRVVVVKCEDITLQNHDADSLGSVLFQTVPTVQADVAVTEVEGDPIELSPLVPEVIQVVEQTDPETGAVTVVGVEPQDEIPAVMGENPIPKVYAVAKTYHTAHVDPVCLYCKNPVGLHRLRFSFSDPEGVSYTNILSLAATMRFESIQ